MLVNCVAYQDGRKLRDISHEEVAAHVSHPERFVWVAFKDPTDEELDAAQRQFGLHPLAAEDARHGHQRPKLEEYGGSLFVVLHTVEVDGEGLRAGEVQVFAAGNYVLSLRRGALQGFADVRARCEREPQLLRLGAGFVLYALVDAVVDRYFPVIDALEAELEQVEQRIFGGAPARATVEQLYGLKQKLNVLQHAVRPLLEAVGKLHGGRVPPLCAGMQDYFRDVSDHLLRITQSIEGLRDMVTTAISVNLTLISMQENETTKRLAAYGALVAVPTLIAGLYGMNFRNMPELSWELGYPVTLGAMVLVDVLIFLRLRRSGWL
ncbi:MAG: magnesium/cobalt transporter CorA [Anaeromyxobacteraceae bacterium]|nr:magnesium/cobalt transporter CorA [Anaeromyxobacteraceae bacterium]